MCSFNYYLMKETSRCLTNILNPSRFFLMKAGVEHCHLLIVEINKIFNKLPGFEVVDTCFLFPQDDFYS